jgi:WD40 repeat protein
VRIWDVRTREIRCALAGHTKGVFAVAFSADDRTVISAGDDATMVDLVFHAAAGPRSFKLGFAN